MGSRFLGGLMTFGPISFNFDVAASFDKPADVLGARGLMDVDRRVARTVNGKRCSV